MFNPAIFPSLGAVSTVIYGNHRKKLITYPHWGSEGLCDKSAWYEIWFFSLYSNENVGINNRAATDLWPLSLEEFCFVISMYIPNILVTFIRFPLLVPHLFPTYNYRILEFVRGFTRLSEFDSVFFYLNIAYGLWLVYDYFNIILMPIQPVFSMIHWQTHNEIIFHISIISYSV